MMEQPIQDGRGQGAVMGKEGGPLLKSAVGGHEQRPWCLAEADHLAEQSGAGLVPGERAELVEDEERRCGLLFPCRLEPTRTLRRGQRVHDIKSTSQEPRGAVEASRRAQRRRSGRFPPTDAAHKDHMGLGLDARQAAGVWHLEAVPSGGPVPAEGLQGCEDGEARQPKAAWGGAIAPPSRLPCQESGSGVSRRPRWRGRLWSECGRGLRDQGALQRGPMVLEGVLSCWQLREGGRFRPGGVPPRCRGRVAGGAHEQGSAPAERG
jgi:hypothetical protein